jgi:ABC-type nitrate/sulfonate/bicarbonate transport system permease component
VKRRELLLAAFALLVAWQVLALIIQLPILPHPLEVLSVFFRELLLRGWQSAVPGS